MRNPITKDAVYVGPDSVVVRRIEQDLILIPVEEGFGRKREDLYTLNPSAQIIWRKINGKRSLKEIAAELKAEFHSPTGVIEKDVAALVRELLERKLLVEVAKT
jgi:hypothetical protein